MRVLHVAPLISSRGEYGGPTSVMQQQTDELRRRGHRVTIAAPVRPSDRGEVARDRGVRAFRALQIPRSGFGGLSSPALIWWVLRNRRSFDVVHIHVARDLVTMPLAWLLSLSGVAYVLQTHGMVADSDHPATTTFDRIFTCRALRRARAVLVLTPAERGSVREIEPRAPLQDLHNGVQDVMLDGGNRLREVVFVARLQERKNPDLFARVALSLREEFPHWSFRIVGPDEGLGDTVTRILAEDPRGDHTSWVGPQTREYVQTVMRQASLLALPSVNEPFPMTVLEAMAHELPVIVTDSCGLAPYVEEAEAGLVVSAEADSLRSAMVHLMADDDERSRMGLNARRLVGERFSIRRVCDSLESLYRSAPRGADR